MSEEPSSERSSSRIRDLRSLFENRASEPSSSPGRGRSPADLAGDDEPRPRSKIRASFIAVDAPNGQPSYTMATAPDFSKIPNSDAKAVIDANPALNREPTTGRRTSFSEKPNSDALQALKATVAQEGERRKSQAGTETVPETAVETPLVETGKQLGASKPARSVSPKKGPSPLQQVQSSSPASKRDKEAENPDKPVTGAEEEPADMKPADPTSAGAVSGGKALSPSAEDLRKTTSKTATKPNSAKPASKPTATSTASKPPRPSMSAKSPQPTTASTRTVTSPKPVTKKASRTSLAAPTAASSAKTAPTDKTAKPASAAVKAKPREPTKPVEVSSRLTAPTAASRARVEGPAAATTASKPAATTTRSKPSSSARPSLGRPESRNSQTGTKKASAPVDGSFLERMTRPTAAFANRTAKEVEAKASAVKQKLPSRPKTNGQTKKPRSSTGTSAEPADETIIDEPSVVHEGSQLGDSTEQAQDAAADNRPGSPKVDHTPVPATNGDHKDAILEGTPAAIGASDSIR
ncbi:hypothetical protein CKM354_000267400 [Cercospora kikuchii]|uniref:Uncharacterized protein n=1 Tax=Cercospora kikuchii TaxID=84275 RepID=A0A9P3F9I6_9PEZI|nr:uncharacterized protein CKM354_000267400 [Cercospora kikuchii]GIZ39286.1 hypothetical protein CKM354_000267400 [Cercospora kikuchii]